MEDGIRDCNDGWRYKRLLCDGSYRDSCVTDDGDMVCDGMDDENRLIRRIIEYRVLEDCLMGLFLNGERIEFKQLW
jgi:hypothetical protein